MKKIAGIILLGIGLLVLAVLLYGRFNREKDWGPEHYGVKKIEKPFVLRKPEKILWQKGEELREYTEKDTYYQELFTATEEIWYSAIDKTGKMEMILNSFEANTLEKDLSKDVRVTFVYEKTSVFDFPSYLRAKYYDFFSSGECALSEDGDYRKSTTLPDLDYKTSWKELLVRGEK